MKVIAILVVALLACVSAIEDDEVMQKWSQFQEDFGRSYRSPVEARTRFAIFKQNVEDNEAHNVRFQAGEVKYSKGINQFSDWTKQEFMQYVNKGLINKPTIKGTIYQRSEVNVTANSVDWRQKGAVTGVKDQGGCGSCWAFSTTGGIEGQLQQKTGKLVSLSEQNLMDCSWSQGNAGCGGGLMTSALEYVQENGIESEDDYPYEETDADCRADSSKVVTRISSYENIQEGDEDSLADAITQRGPISVAIDATYELQQYSGGILDDDECDSYSLNHGVLAVGLGSEGGQDYYIVKNSWGRSWGEQGYFRLPRNADNKCGIASMASVPSI